MSNIKYINTKKAKHTLSPIGMKSDKIYDAHSLSHPGYIAYVPKTIADALAAVIRDLGKEEILKELGYGK